MAAGGRKSLSKESNMSGRVSEAHFCPMTVTLRWGVAVLSNVVGMKLNKLSYHGEMYSNWLSEGKFDI